RLPVSGLRYWVLGLPDPAAPPAAQDRELDGLGHLTRLRQSGWDIEFRRYSPVTTVDLPNKIFLTNQAAGVRLEVRLAVEQWELGTAANAALTGN
ncbi:MAG TPA: lipoprotein insertase outer membrane protein LolB, partial [Gammaproteobacteria bacterium]|nr:lipoprotein insertase outer membrane protein LolB [Gammaproteobacteria bacterium]